MVTIQNLRAAQKSDGELACGKADSGVRAWPELDTSTYCRPHTACITSSRACTNTSLGEHLVYAFKLVTKYHRKEEFSIIIIGLDGAGKTVNQLPPNVA